MITSKFNVLCVIKERVRKKEKDALQSNSLVSFTAVTQELTFSGLIVKFQFFLLVLVVGIPLAASTPAGREHRQRVSIRDGLHWFSQKQNVLIPVIPSQEAGAVQVGFG